MRGETKIWNEVEKSAWRVVREFKEHPVRTVLLSLLVIWFIKKLIAFIKD